MRSLYNFAHGANPGRQLQDAVKSARSVAAGHQPGILPPRQMERLGSAHRKLPGAHAYKDARRPLIDGVQGMAQLLARGGMIRRNDAAATASRQYRSRRISIPL